MVTACRATRTRGYSLIELLIATTIAGLTIGLATYSFSLFSSAWSRFAKDWSRSAAQMQRLELVEAAVESAVPWVVRGRNGNPGYYFLGREEGLTLVTSRAVFSPGGLAVIRLFREPDTNGNFMLVYEEAPLNDMLLKNAEQVLPFQQRIVVVRGLKGITFRYFGWADANAFARSLDETVEQPLWFSDYDGLSRNMHPFRIGVGLGGNEIVYPMARRKGYFTE